MKYAESQNDKTGPNSLTTSRPVGTSCPSNCWFLNNGCYAENTEIRWPVTRKFALPNMRVSAKGIVRLLLRAKEKDKSVRTHERGDFLNTKGNLDLPYIKAWRTALSMVDGVRVWTYSHVLLKTIANLNKCGMVVYASVHNTKDIAKAKKAGFTRFAFASSIRKPRGKNPDIPPYMEVEGLGKCLVCPAQRLGIKRITCTGGKGTLPCMVCVRGTRNVIFLQH